jgi:hypothetical protein
MSFVTGTTDIAPRIDRRPWSVWCRRRHDPQRSTALPLIGNHCRYGLRGAGQQTRVGPVSQVQFRVPHEQSANFQILGIRGAALMGLLTVGPQHSVGKEF